MVSSFVESGDAASGELTAVKRTPSPEHPSGIGD
jgi:hypothetical protein